MLKRGPCPYCGCNSVKHGSTYMNKPNWIQCAECQTSGPKLETKEDAIDAWNGIILLRPFLQKLLKSLPDMSTCKEIGLDPNFINKARKLLGLPLIEEIKGKNVI